MYGPGLGLLQGEGSSAADVGHGGAELYIVLAGGGFPGAGGLVEGSQLVGTHLEGKGLTFAGLQFLRLAKGLEFAGGFLETAFGSAHVEFHHFLAGHLAGVGHGDAGGETVLVGLHHGFAVGEGGVAEAIAEGIGNLNVTGDEVAVAHPDAFLIVGVVHILLRLAGAPGEAAAGGILVVVREVGAGG